MSAAEKPRAKDGTLCGSRSNAASSSAMYGAMPVVGGRRGLSTGQDPGSASRLGWVHRCRHKCTTQCP